MLSILSCQKFFYNKPHVLFTSKCILMQKFQIEKKNSRVTAQNEKLNLHKSTANAKTHFPKISLALAK